MRPRRIVQILSLLLFIALLGLSGFPDRTLLPVDTFLRMDPAVWIAVMAAAKQWVELLWPAPLLLMATLLLGRFFCGWMCPLGTSLDAFEWLFRISNRRARLQISEETRRRLNRFRYHVLIFMVGAALAGLSLIFALSPIVLASRLFGLILFPLLNLLVKSGLTAVRPLAEILDIPSLIFAEIGLRGYGMLWFTAATSLIVFGLSFLTPRFWCRYLCPAGAAFSLFSPTPRARRNVSSTCTDCGKCRDSCPTGAIGQNPLQTDFKQCIVCETCIRTCPVDAIDIGFGKNKQGGLGQQLPFRRQFLATGLAGIITALIAWTGIPLPEARSSVEEGGPVVRPPGSRPETEFLARCIRCGVCMTACPTNTLQPRKSAGGLFSLLSPMIVPRIGPCEPDCNACGLVCPTGAIQPLHPDERQWSKTGTAVILRNQCIVWKHDRKCLVCDEVCPYDAVELRHVTGKPNAVPFVIENRCSGCGYCEYHCPVKPGAAIVVQSRGEIRISSGSPKKAAIAAGCDLKRSRKPVPAAMGEGASPYGEHKVPFTGTDLPPGFTEYPKKESK